MIKIKVVDREGTIIFSCNDKYNNMGYDARVKIFESFMNKECKITVDER